ncbi:MAG: DUF2273 domain-containing protein [Selenomonadales bacterium]|nr:DUF2273 domain-containing protein [Selenomonadales bacterium]
MRTIIRALLMHYRGRVIGTVAGITFALVYLYFGFLQTLFIGACALIGYYIGTRLDADEDLRSLLERILPPVD